MDKSDKTHRIISVLMKEARYSMDHEHFEDAVFKLQRCLQWEDEPESRATMLDHLGYCFLKLGWFEEAVKIYKEYLKLLPSDNDGRFFLASAYASLKWTGDAIEELRTILASDPNDVLARHDLGLCYRNMGWMKESLEEMKSANSYAMIYGNPEEKELRKHPFCKFPGRHTNLLLSCAQFKFHFFPLPFFHYLINDRIFSNLRLSSP